jgi:hypothetical protein
MILALAAGLALAAEDPDWIARPPPAIPVRMIHVMDQYRYFIDCVANRDWVTARPLFDTPLRSRDEGRALARIGGGSHGSGCSYAFEMRMTGILMRGGIAEARYRQIYGRGATLPVDPAVAPVADGAVFAWVGFGHESDAQTLYDLAACLAERETGAVHAVLMTRQALDQERAAFQRSAAASAPACGQAVRCAPTASLSGPGWARRNISCSAPASPTRPINRLIILAIDDQWRPLSTYIRGFR